MGGGQKMRIDRGDQMDLTPKQKAFADEYIKNGGNASDAARKAGYSEKTAYSMGQQNLKKLILQDLFQEYTERV